MNKDFHFEYQVEPSYKKIQTLWFALSKAMSLYCVSIFLICDLADELLLIEAFEFLLPVWEFKSRQLYILTSFINKL